MKLLAPLKKFILFRCYPTQSYLHLLQRLERRRKEWWRFFHFICMPVLVSLSSCPFWNHNDINPLIPLFVFRLVPTISFPPVWYTCLMFLQEPILIVILRISYGKLGHFNCQIYFYRSPSYYKMLVWERRYVVVTMIIYTLSMLYI